ncbi:MAG TPA: GxGYxYP domain-containing protein, partial [Bacteroidota bacterium]
GPRLVLIRTWGTGRSYRDSLSLQVGGAVNTVPVSRRVFPSNSFMGLREPAGSQREIRAYRTGDGGIRLEESFRLSGSQGIAPVTATHLFSITPDSKSLVYEMRRSTRTSGPPVRFTLSRTGADDGYGAAPTDGYLFRLEDNWEIDGKLPLQAFFISLQGVVNKSGPRVYILYPDNWPFTYVQSVFNFYRDTRHYTFRELRTPEEALQTLKRYVRGYVVWDKKVRTSLIVALTVAGLENAVVASEEMIPSMENAGLKPVQDFRGKFTGQNDAEIYSWAYKQYWGRCNKQYIVWMGGEGGKIMKPGVADWGLCKGAFFSDLSCRRTDTAEYALADRLLSEMKPMSMVMGWHSYAKDLEREYVRLTSSHGHRVEGLHTLPNLSFSAQVPASPGFVYRNNHHVQPGQKIVPARKVYVTCIQTDGIGLGAWLKPGRGEIPYAWEVLMNYTWMAPAMAEYFYTMATPNDYFIGCLSGPGYLYPKVVPPDTLKQLIALARDQMKVLDLKVFETMDYSEGATVEGNSDLPRNIVDLYYQGMPEAIGFVNGYAPSYTFAVKDGRPFMSYDYYLSPVRPEADAVADLQELARVNSRRPYFLLMHIRESSDIKRVKGILDRLGPEFQVVPLDTFLTMAGSDPTFRERFRDPADGVSLR